MHKALHTYIICYSLSRRVSIYCFALVAITNRISATAQLPPLKLYFDAIVALKKADLEWTVIYNGLFLDYFTMPHIKTHLSPNVIALDIAHKHAAIPGTGQVPITFTYTHDVAKFIVMALDLPKWDHESRIVGDTLTWNEFLKVAEETLGKSCLAMSAMKSKANDFSYRCAFRNNVRQRPEAGVV